MTQIKHIKKERFEKGKSIRCIARETGHDFRTVKKFIEKSDFNEPAKRKSGRPSKLDPYKETIDTWLLEDKTAKPKQRHTAKRICDRLKEKYPESFNVSERTVRAYVAAKKKEIYGVVEGYLPLGDDRMTG